MELCIDNRQNLPLPQGIEQKIEQALLAGLAVEGYTTKVEISLSFVDEEEIRTLNREYRNRDDITDVLSFPLEEDFPQENELLGDIVLCVKRAEEQAREYGHSTERELIYLSIHSLFHLLGYDHMEEEEKKIMRQKEKDSLKKLEEQNENGR